MVKIKIQEIAKQRGIETAYQLQKALGTYPSAAAQLWKGEMKMIGIETLDKLCDALECEPGDLLVRVKEGKPTKKGGRKEIS